LIPVYSLYKDVVNRINLSENGNLSLRRFNEVSWLAQLSLLDWLSGDISAAQPPEPYLSQKNKDWLSTFITTYKAQVKDGVIAKPKDYYLFQDIVYLTADKEEDRGCIEDEEGVLQVQRRSVDLLDSGAFTQRSNTFIKSLKPQVKPICKMVGSGIVFNPPDIGSVELDYVRLPKRAEIKIVMDNVYNTEVADEANSINFEWSEFARGILVWFIVDECFNSTREQAGKTFNKMTAKTVREEK
jgi:hypothetical protein